MSTPLPDDERPLIDMAAEDEMLLDDDRPVPVDEEQAEIEHPDEDGIDVSDLP